MTTRTNSFALSGCGSPAWRRWRCGPSAPPTVCVACAVCHLAVRCFGSRISGERAEREREGDSVVAG